MKRLLGLVLPHREHAVEHVPEAEPLAELLQHVAPSGVNPELGALLDRDPAGAVHRAPHPRDEVAPVVEVEVRDRDRIHVWPALPLAEARQDTRAAVDEEAAGTMLDDVPGVGAAGVGPGGRAADDGEFHRRILPRWSGRRAW